MSAGLEAGRGVVSTRCACDGPASVECTWTEARRALEVIGLAASPAATLGGVCGMVWVAVGGGAHLRGEVAGRGALACSGLGAPFE